jgi:hypothetical protein
MKSICAIYAMAQMKTLRSIVWIVSCLTISLHIPRLTHKIRDVSNVDSPDMPAAKSMIGLKIFALSADAIQ